jgi:hypothetical protein
MKDQIKTISDLYEEGKDCLHTLPIGQFHGDEMKAHARAFEVLRELRDIAAVAAKDVGSLEQWKKEAMLAWSPLINYCHDSKNGKRLGIGLGQSIPTRVLEILKEIK